MPGSEHAAFSNAKRHPRFQRERRPVPTSMPRGSPCLAGHLQDKGFARGFDDSFAPIFRIIDPENPTKLRTSVSLGYLGHQARPPKSAEDLVGLVVVDAR